MTRAYLGLGSNVGDREAFLGAARSGLESGGVRLVRQSTVIETQPFGEKDQPLFLNQVLEIDWTGPARALLDLAKAVELHVGRTPTYRWGPREIDIDILLFGDEVIDEPDLQIPHPGLAEREFILQSLRELGATPHLTSPRPAGGGKRSD